LSFSSTRRKLAAALRCFDNGHIESPRAFVPFTGKSMQKIHLPILGARYWVALCIASIFGANMGDFFAHHLGLGHVAGLPYLAVALAAVVIAERFDRSWNESYYWIAIIIIRTAATNVADFASGDLKQPRTWVMLGLTVLLIAALWTSWRVKWRSASAESSANSNAVLRADLGYWTCMFIAGVLGTVMGDYCSRNLQLGDGGAAVLLSPLVVLLFIVGRSGLLRLLPFYWFTVVMIRAAGTAVGDFFAGRDMLGLPLSTLATGILFVGVLIAWRSPAKSEQLALKY
jgi:uncharacterized membrane-anchored protein